MSLIRIEEKLSQICDSLYSVIKRYQIDDYQQTVHLHEDHNLKGAIIDPIEKCVVVPHYATSHFGLAAILRYQRLKDEDALSRAIIAFKFVTTNNQSESAKDPEFHWDFKNLALALYLTYGQEALGETTPTYWNFLRQFRCSTTLAANWFAMRSVRFGLSFVYSRSLTDFLKSLGNAIPVALAIRNDGCIDDFYWQSRPIQYAVYTAALLDIHPLIPLWLKRRTVLRSASYLAQYILPTGQFNYRGRGHEQIFGYASAIYLLTVALNYSIQLNHSELQSELQHNLYLVTQYLEQFQNQEELLPLILNQKKDAPRWGFYDYHYASVYNAFTLAWLELTLRKLQTTDIGNLNCASINPPTTMKLWFSRSSGTVSIRTIHYQCLFTRGETRYLADAGITPHVLWIDQIGAIFSCPGGPESSRHGVKHRYYDVTANFMCPIFKPTNDNRWFGPSHGRAIKFNNPASDMIELAYETSYYLVRRSVRFQVSEIKVSDSIELKSDISGKLRIFNWPVPNTLNIDLLKDKIQIKSDNGKKTAEIGFEELFTELTISNDYVENPLGAFRTVYLETPKSQFEKEQIIKLDWYLKITCT